MKPMLVGAGIGAMSSLAMGKDPLLGAALGGVSGGMFGGAEGIGSGFGMDFGSALAPNVGANSVMAGNALGQGGFNTVAGQGLMNASAPSVASLTPNIGSVVTPEYAPNLLMDSAYNAQVAPTSMYTGDLSMMANQNLGGATPIGLNNSVTASGGGYDPSLGAEQLNYQPDFSPISGAEQGTGGYEPVKGIMDYLGDFVPSEQDMGQLALQQGVEYLTPEQQKILQHQQGLAMTGTIPQTGFGIGNSYISRA